MKFCNKFNLDLVFKKLKNNYRKIQMSHWSFLVENLVKL